MTLCALPKTESVGDDLQSTAHLSTDDDDYMLLAMQVLIRLHENRQFQYCVLRVYNAETDVFTQHKKTKNRSVLAD